MSGSERGLLVVLTGPSGVGKGTVVSRLRERLDDARSSTSVTTRPPRPGERDGVDYHFVDEERFDELVGSGDLLEWADYAGHRYGTPARPVAEAVAGGAVVILEIEVDGALQVREQRPDALLIFLEPPDRDELARRLRDRGTEDEQTVRRRLDVARTELAHKDRFDAQVVNDDLEQAVADVERLIRRGRRRSPDG